MRFENGPYLRAHGTSFRLRNFIGFTRFFFTKFVDNFRGQILRHPLKSLGIWLYLRIHFSSRKKQPKIYE